MAPQSRDKSRRRKRKARTEVSSSSSSSESEVEKSPSPPPQSQQEGHAKIQEASSSFQGLSSDSAEPASTTKTQTQDPKDPEKAFEDFYLKQATREFANDIDKLRSAPDFNERHVPVLIQALRQGTGCFSREERVKVGGVATK